MQCEQCEQTEQVEQREQLEQDEAGLTGLQELAIAILVVAILVVGGLFAFGAFKGSAQTSVAQQTAVNTLQDAHGLYANDSSNYPAVTSLTGTLNADEPGFTFQGTATTAAKTISVGVSTDGQQIVIATYQPSGPNCYFIVDNQVNTPNGPVNANLPTAMGTWYGYAQVTGAAGQGTVASCKASNAPSAANTAEGTWGTNW